MIRRIFRWFGYVPLKPAPHYRLTVSSGFLVLMDVPVDCAAYLCTVNGPFKFPLKDPSQIEIEVRRFA